MQPSPENDEPRLRLTVASTEKPEKGTIERIPNEEYMRRLLILVLLLAPVREATAQHESKKDYTIRRDTTGRITRIDIAGIDVVAERPMKKIGTQESRIESRVLHDNIASQMSDALKFGTSIYVKEYGRATLSTVSFRGTSPSHTQVTWNGMKINSPMLGMVDFSMIPSYFIDEASLLHGTSSVNTTGGGLGGAVVLATGPAGIRGFGLQYIQGIGMWKTCDEYLRLTCGNDRWQASTRFVCSSSDNDFKYTNYMKSENVYDDDRNIVAQYHPVERNRSCDFRDLHLLQEIYYNSGNGNRFGLSAWYLHSQRGVPMLNVDYRNDSEYANEQTEETFRGVVSWDRIAGGLKLGAKAGYIGTSLAYDYARSLGNGDEAKMIESRSRVHTAFGNADAEYSVGNRWLFTANVSLHQHFVESRDRNIIRQNGDYAVVGYDNARIELAGYVSAKWRPTERFGMALALREELYGTEWTPLVPALFLDGVLSKRGSLIVKASVSRNYRVPTLNDLYFQPGGNPDLRKEHGFTYDCGLEFTAGRAGSYKLHGEATWFDSYIDDWIVWLPSFKGFWEPLNIKQVHAYGIELKANLNLLLGQEWSLDIDGNFSWTPSINHGDPVNWADEAIGKQLVYVPERSAAINGMLAYRTWTFEYKWCHYSERYTTSSNETVSKISRVRPYYMSDVALKKQFGCRWSDFSVKLSVKNLFDEAYESVLSRPMPGINFEVFLELKPRWGKGH